jgi:ribonuclease J
MNFHPELPTPPPLAEGTLRMIALGGLGEVGRNMHVIEYNGRLLIIDCGVLFPEENQPGVDLVLPDLSYLEDRLDDIEAIVLTHGHEDHIGAVPYLLRMRQDIPILGSQLTLAFLEAKLAEHRIKPLTLGVKEGQREKIKDFDVEFVAVNHSIPDALAVFVRTPAGTILNTGDFKMDQLPLDGRITDLRAFARFGEEGVDLFQVDSTNAEVPGFTTSEVEIAPTLDRLFANATGRVIVASFASHVHRVQQVIDAAHSHGRRVAFVGRSMVRNMNIAAELGFLKVPDGILIDFKKADQLPPEKVVFMSTGSQGEPMAALSRMANKDHKIEVGSNDLVILASSLIPGNENAVFRVINGLMRIGATVVHQSNARVHVSGHASAGELLYCYNIVRPKNVMPIHGEVRHLLANGNLAVKTGIPRERVMFAENGVVIDMMNGKAQIAGAIEFHNMYVDGSSVGELTESELKDRRILADEGFVTVFVVMDSSNGTVLSGPEVHARGLAEDDSAFDPILPEIKKALEEAAKTGAADNHQLQQIMRRVVGRYVGTKLRRRPMIIPIVIDA